MNQNSIEIPETVSSLESIFQRHEIRLVEESRDDWNQCYSTPPEEQFDKIVELFENLKQKADENNAECQRDLGFCYEQGISDKWCKARRRIVEIDILRQQLSNESHKYNELQEQLHKLWNQSPRGSELMIQAHINRKALEEQLIKIKDSLLGNELLAEVKKAKQLFWSFTSEPEQAFYWYDKAVQNGDKNACLDLGFCYLRGFGVAPDQQKAIALFKEAAEAKNSIAIRILGDCYAEGVVFNKDIPKAHEYWSTANAYKGLGLTSFYFVLQRLLSPFRDEKQQLEIDTKKQAYQANLDLDFEQLMLFYLKKGCFPENALYQRQEWWDGQIKQKNIVMKSVDEVDGKLVKYLCTYYLKDTQDISILLKRYAASACYEGIPADSRNDTQGIEKNPNKALEIWLGLAENNDPWAYCRLGCHYLNQNLPTYDVTKALAYFNKAAECNFYPAHFALALIYYYGINVEINLDIALAYFGKVLSIDENISSLPRILSFHDGENIADIYKQISSYKKIDHGEYSWVFIEEIRLACFLFGKNISNAEGNLKILVALVGKKPISVSEKVLTKFKDNPAMLLICLYALGIDKQQSKSKQKWYPDETEEEIELNNGRISNKLRLNNKIILDIKKAIILELTNQKLTNHWPYIIECPVVFNAVFNWIYLEHYDPLLLGILYFHKSNDFESSCCEISKNKNIELALRWLQTSDNLLPSPWLDDDIFSRPLSGYYQALLHEHNNPAHALEVLISSEPDEYKTSKLEASFAFVRSKIDGIDEYRPSKNVDAGLLPGFKLKRLELQTRIELRIEVQNAKRHAERAEDEAIRANDLKARLEKLVQRTSHTLANTIFPNILYQVAEHLKDKVEFRRDALLLRDAYHAEVSIRHENELLQQRYLTDSPEPLRQIMRGDRRKLPNTEARSIEELFNYALSRVLARILNADSAKFEPIRQQIMGNKELSLDALRQDFEEAMFFQEPPMTAQAWCQQNLRPVKLIYRNPLWREIGLKREGLAEALLYGHFAEVLYNAFKYADHTDVDFLQLELDELYEKGEQYLTLTLSNPMSTLRPKGMGSNKGLEAIEEDLRQLNGQHEGAPTLKSWEDKGCFYLRLYYQADLLWLQPMPEVDIASLLFKD